LLIFIGLILPWSWKQYTSLKCLSYQYGIKHCTALHCTPLLWEPKTIQCTNFLLHIPSCSGSSSSLGSFSQRVSANWSINRMSVLTFLFLCPEQFPNGLHLNKPHMWQIYLCIWWSHFEWTEPSVCYGVEKEPKGNF
jgi:hypothetical protein